MNRIDPTGMEYYWNDDGTEPVWIDGDEDVDGYDYHSTDYDEQSGEDDNYHWVHHGPPDSGSQDSQDYTNEANYSLYGFAPPAYQDHSGTSNNGNAGSSNQNSSGGQKQPSLLTTVQYGVNGATSTALLGKSILMRGLANDFIAGGDVAEITNAAAQLNEIAAPIKILGSALGVVSAIEHGKNLITDYQRDGLWSAGVAINTGKLVLDGVFFFAKSTDPVFLGAAIAYGVTDYLTNDK